MPNYIMTLQQRLAGNLYDNRYYVQGADVAAATAAANAIISAQAQIQTPDVEYVGCLLTLAEGGHITTPVDPVYNSGIQEGSGNTLPAPTFLEFIFFSDTEKGKTSHRIRGSASTNVTGLGVFNVDTAGVGDFTGVNEPPVTTIYSEYIAAVVEHSKDKNFGNISGSNRVSVGFRRAARRL